MGWGGGLDSVASLTKPQIHVSRPAVQLCLLVGILHELEGIWIDMSPHPLNSGQIFTPPVHCSMIHATLNSS